MTHRHTIDASPSWIVSSRWEEHSGGEYRLITNSLGLREDKEIARERPWRRILVIGDSHTDGICSNQESYANRLEALLGERHEGRSFDVLNAGVGGYSFYNYLGAFQRYLEFGIDTVVVGVYGGNDFYEVTGPALVYAGKKRRPWGSYKQKIESAMSGEGGSSALGQGLITCAFFARNPDLIEFSINTAAEVLLELHKRCEAGGINFIVIYIPPAQDVQWKHHEASLQRAAETLELTRQDIDITQHQAKRLLERLVLDGVTVLDMTAVFQTAKQSPYWRWDLHINVDAQDLVARELLPLLERGY